MLGYRRHQIAFVQIAECSHGDSFFGVVYEVESIAAIYVLRSHPSFECSQSPGGGGGGGGGGGSHVRWKRAAAAVSDGSYL